MAVEAAEVMRLDRLDGWPAPEERADWLGEAEVERTLLAAYRTGRMHHAWLLGGPKGIGKATLAYRFARFVLANPDPAAPAVMGAADLAVPPEHPAFRKVASRSHANLLVLERPYREDRKRFLTELSVDEVRKTVAFFGSTSAEGGFRVAIVDCADDMNQSAANALLKVLEEPPSKSLFLLICHAPGRLLPTIRSRCRRLDLKPLSAATVTAALSAAGAVEEDVAAAAALAEGSLRRAIQLLDEDGIGTYREFARLAARLPDLDVPAMHDFADKVTRRGHDDAYFAFLDMVRAWLQRRVRGEGEPVGDVRPAPAAATVPLARWAEVWEKVEQSSAEAEDLNLDRKQVVLAILMTLARAARM